MKKALLIIGLFVLVIVVVFAFTERDQKPTITESERELTTVVFGNLPYGDHSYSIIGAEKGWFEEVGIDFQYKLLKAEDIIPFLKNGSVDVLSTPPGILMASHDNAPNLISFAFGGFFQGFAIMAQPDAGYKSVDDFVAEGMDLSEAIASTAAQLKGKNFTYPSEAAIQPFIDLSLKSAGLGRDDITSLILDDPLTVNAMRTGQADFQAGGVPSRITLQKEGFVPILSSAHIAANAEPTETSDELAAVLPESWATTKESYDENYETMLRLASVKYRIIQHMNEDFEDAASIHGPYLSKITGEEFDRDDLEIIYTDLDPFITFEAQHEWFHDQESPFYYRNINGSALNIHKKNDIFEATDPDIEDIVFADDTYYELERLREEANELFVQIENSNLKKGAQEKFERAQHMYSIYNFLDASRLAEEVVNSLND